MPYEPSDVVDFCVTKEVQKLEAAIADILDMRLAGIVDKQRELVGASYSKEDE